MAELRSAIFWVLNCPIYLLRCYRCGFEATKARYLNQALLTDRIKLLYRLISLFHIYGHMARTLQEFFCPKRSYVSPDTKLHNDKHAL
jgi:hypothetical protein